MHIKDDMKMEWNNMMSSMNKLDGMMKEMDMKGMEETSEKWDDMMDDAREMQDMMMEKMP